MKNSFFKKTAALVMAVLMAVTMVPAMPAMRTLAAEQTQNTIMKGIFDKLVENKAYKELQAAYGEKAALTEEYKVQEDGSEAIILTLTPSPENMEIYGGVMTATYTLDKDNFICFKSSDGDYFSIMLFGYIMEALCEYYGMEVDLVSGYFYAIPAKEDDPNTHEATYCTVKVEGASQENIIIKLYAGAKWDEAEVKKLLDEVWFSEERIQKENFPEPLKESGSLYGSLNLGKFKGFYDGNKYDFTLTLAEYVKFDERGYQSIINLVKALAPEGVETFDYTGGPEAGKGVWTVKKLEDEAVPEEFQSLVGRYEMLQVRFASPYIEFWDEDLAAGDFRFLTVQNTEGSVKKWSSSNKKIVSVNKEGEITALKKGTATITATLDDGTRLTCKIKVKNSPTIKVGGKKFVSSKTYTVKKGKTLKVTIKGKAFSVKNKYASTKSKVAKVTSKKDEETVKIKGLKKGKATVSITVNGVVFKVKVKVV